MICLHTGAHFNNGRKFFNFSKIIPEESSQQDVFNECQLKEMCFQFLVKGQNSNVMVYGPTNSGKTFTMLGKNSEME